MIQMVFPEGKRKAFTTSYDDGVRQDKRLVECMNRYGIKGTFNINSGLFGREEHVVIEGFNTDICRFRETGLGIYDGHEIAVHGLTHMKLTDISTGTAVYEVIEDRKNLETATGKMIHGFAYPFGAYDKQVIQALKDCNIHYGRTVVSTGKFEFPKDFLAWHPTCHHNDPKLMQLIDSFCKKEVFYGEPWVFYCWGHAYEFDQRDNWEVIEEAFQVLNNYKDQIWMATNDEI